MFNMEKVRVGISLQIRVEMFNAFNRLYLANPAGGLASATTYNAAGNLTGGWIDPTSTSGGLPRNG
jgi:hypothetical protein